MYLRKTDTMPGIIAVCDNCIIGSDKLIFCDHINEDESDIDFTVITYPEHITCIEENEEYKNYDKVLWYDNYYFTYKDNGNIIQIHKKKNNKYIIVENICCDSEYQFGDRIFKKNALDNGDIIFENYGDVKSTIIFTKNNPKIKGYSTKLSAKLRRKLDTILHHDDYASYYIKNDDIDWTNEKEANKFYEKLDRMVKKMENKKYYNQAIDDIFNFIEMSKKK